MNMNEPSGFDAGYDPDGIAMLRVPPHSIKAESSVLGALLLDNRSWDRICAVLTDPDFYRHEHRLLFGAIGALVNGNRDAVVVTVFEHLQNLGKGEEAGGLVYLNSLAQYVPSAASIRRYAEIAREKAVLRRLVATSDEIAAAAFNPGDRFVAELLDDAQQKVFAIGEQGAPRDDWQAGEQGALELLDAIQARHDGKDDFTPTGLIAIDNMLNGGMRPGQAVVIAGRPSMGKTALSLSIGEQVADTGRPVGVLSMEMPKAEVQSRRIAIRSRIPFHKILRPERIDDAEWDRLTEAIEALRLTPLYVSDQTALTISNPKDQAVASL
jgi:replicative DNA helicase